LASTRPKSAVVRSNCWVKAPYRFAFPALARVGALDVQDQQRALGVFADPDALGRLPAELGRVQGREARVEHGIEQRAFTRRLGADDAEDEVVLAGLAQL
jgi:hypothetical protein